MKIKTTRHLETINNREYCVITIYPEGHKPMEFCKPVKDLRFYLNYL